MNNTQIQMKMHDQKVSHLLHLILAIISMGFWVPVWIIITVSSNLEKRRLMGKLKGNGNE